MLLLLAAAALLPPPAQTAIKEAVGKQLSDPYSAQYDWQPIKSGTLYCGWVNAKNAFGAYTGYQPFMVQYFTSKSGKVTVLMADLRPAIVSRMCLESGYRLSR